MSVIGDKIKQARQSRGWSQEDLALKMGYKSKSTINKIELGINDIPQSKVAKFAQVLGVTPGFLMGWVTEEDSVKNNQIAKLIIRMRTDEDFLATVAALSELSEKQYRGVRELIAAFDD